MTVYSLTQFFNELDLLEIRLETLWDVVDYFVISESTKTHSGKDKPLYYNENKKRYEKYQAKIIHQIIRDTPGSVAELKAMKPKNAIHETSIENVENADWFDKNIESYLRDTYEKEVLVNALPNKLQEKDVILLGDLDEIPHPEKVKMVVENFKTDAPYHFRNDMFYYYFNNQKVNEPWVGTLAISAKDIWTNSFCELRTHKRGHFIDNAGWHFTYMGGVEKIKEKVESWGEQSLNTPTIKQNISSNVENCFELQRDLFFRPAYFLLRNINDGTFPKYIVENQDKFSRYIKK